MNLHVRPMKSRAYFVFLCLCALCLSACRKTGDEGANIPAAEGSSKTKLNLRRPTNHPSPAETSDIAADLSSDTTQTLATQTITTQTL